MSVAHSPLLSKYLCADRRLGNLNSRKLNGQGMWAQSTMVRGMQHANIYMQSYAWCLQLRKHLMSAIIWRHVVQCVTKSAAHSTQTHSTVLKETVNHILQLFWAVVGLGLNGDYHASIVLV
jgi:hypothetical protein